MAATTIRVDRRVKAGLDRLHRRLQARTGEQRSQSELLARLLQFAERNEAAFLEESGVAWKPPTREEMRRLLGRVKRGPRTDSSQLDQALYGGEAP